MVSNMREEPELAGKREKAKQGKQKTRRPSPDNFLLCFPRAAEFVHCPDDPLPF